MILLKALLPALLAAASLSGCVYDEAYYEEPRPTYRGGYAEREVVVVQQRPAYYYEERPRYYYGGRAQYYPQSHQRAYYQPGYPSNRARYPSGGYTSYNQQRSRYEDRDRDRDRDRDNDNGDDRRKSDDGPKKKPSQSPSVGARNNTRVVAYPPNSGARDRPKSSDKDDKDDKKKRKKDD